MKCTKISNDIQRSLLEVIDRYPEVREIINDIGAYGGRAYVVGGAVRDLYMGIAIKDLDIEIHSMPIDALEALLGRYGQVNNVGKSFGVLRVGSMDIDWSLPRADSAGRKPTVSVDPDMGIQQACARRDLTMNAMAIDLHSYELHDPFDGLMDIKNKRLRAPQEDFFVQDPLRFFRVMQFISRFSMTPDDALNALCKKMLVDQVSRERIEQEFKKMLLKSARPSLGLRWLKEIGRVKEVLPELAATIGVEQPLEWHPEGDVFEHSMQALDAAAQLSYDSDEQKLIMLYAALCHDLGKAVTTKFNTQKGRVTSFGHDAKGVPLARAMLKRITHHKDIIETVEKLVRYHLMPLAFYNGQSKPPAYKRLARNLAPHATLAMLAKLSRSDIRGRNGESQQPLTHSIEAVDEFERKAQEYKVFHGPQEPILLGKDLIDIIEPGPRMGLLVKLAYEIQLQEGIDDKDELKRRLMAQKGTIDFKK